jgi:phosphatidylglycerophosphate synthase
MNKSTARKIADGLTWARIWSAIPITIAAWLGLEWWVLGLYVAAAMTDLLDGYFGRRATPPLKDIDFDGLADTVFAVMTLVWLWMLIPGFFESYWLPYLPVLVLIEIYIVSVRVRWPELKVPHFEFGRFSMVVFCLLLPVLILIRDNPWFVHGVFILGTVSKMQLVQYLYRCEKPQLAGRNNRNVA